MSHWGKCTGYDYTSERLGFLNQYNESQRRIAAQAAARPLGFTGTRSCQMGTTIRAPLGTPRALRLDPLPQPLPRDDLYTRRTLSTAVHRRSARSLGQLAPSTPAINEPYRGPQSCSHLAYCRPTSAFRRTFGTVHTNGKARDDTTQFRESVFGVWNTRGEKHPAGFRP